MLDYYKMTSEELEDLITAKYGPDWKLADLDEDDDLSKAFFESLTKGQQEGD